MALLTPQRNGYLYWLGRDPDGTSPTSTRKPTCRRTSSRASIPRPADLTSISRTSRQPARAAQFCPGLWGGKDWPFEAYNPKTGMVYIPTNENHCNRLEGKVEQRVPGQWWTGVAIPDIHFTVDTKAGFFGEIEAYDVNTGKRAWRQLYSNSMMWGSMLTTAGDLVFGGGTNDRQFRAYDAKLGRRALALQDQLR